MKSHGLPQIMMLTVAVGAWAAPNVSEILAVTGGRHARIIYRKNAHLCRFDTRENREIEYDRWVADDMMVSATGGWMLYSRDSTSPDWSYRDKTTFARSWDGTREKFVGPGILAATLLDRATGVEWVYLSEPRPGGDGPQYPIARRRLDKPSVREVVWYKPGTDKPAIYSWFSIHQSGTRGLGDRGDLTLPNGTYTNRDYGCFHNYSQDLSAPDRFICLLGGHQTLMVYPEETTVNCMPPGFPQTDQMWNLRFTTSRRLFTISDRDTKSTVHGFWIGRFDASFTGVESWARIGGDGYGGRGHAWIEADADTAPLPTGTADTTTPPSVDTADTDPGPTGTSPFSILAPAAGEALRVGESLTVRWNVDRTVLGSGEIVVSLSIDNGKSFVELHGNGIRPVADTGSFTWVVDLSLLGALQPAETLSCVVRISDYMDEHVPASSPEPFYVVRTTAANRAPAARRGPYGTGEATLSAVALVDLRGRRLATPGSRGPTPAIAGAPGVRIAAEVEPGRSRGVDASRALGCIEPSLRE